MRNEWKWAAIILAVLLVVILVGVPLLTRFGWGEYGWAPMMHGGYYRPHMFGGFGFFGGGLMMVGMLLLPLALVGLLVLGGVALFRGMSGSPPVQAAGACSSCGKPLQAGWAHCPYCGEKV